MDITDDGIGIDETALAKAGSLGLLGIQERVGAFGGALVVLGQGRIPTLPQGLRGLAAGSGSLPPVGRASIVPKG
jgi:glucose-6-phosphate-specific signal transduction histidine kinase